MTRSKLQSTSDTELCSTCKKAFASSDAFFSCFTCEKKLHLTTNCTLLSQVAIDGIRELGSNAVLFSIECDQAKKDIKLRECRNQLKELKADKVQSVKSTGKKLLK